MAENKTEGSAGQASQDILILLVEDYDGDALLIQEKLRISPIEGYRVERTRSLQETRDWLDSNQPEVILLDMNLGDSRGLETVSGVLEKAGDAAIIVLTGTAGTEFALQALDAGAQDYLSKDEINARSLQRIVVFAMYRRRSQMRKMREVLADYRAVSRPLGSGQPLKERDADHFHDLLAEYNEVLHRYMDTLILRRAKPTAALDDLAEQFGAAGAGPRDLLDVHVETLEAAIESAPPGKAQYLNADGRLLALELMGRLVDFYRGGDSHSQASN